MAPSNKIQSKIKTLELVKVLTTAIGQAAEINVTTCVAKDLDNPKSCQQRFSTLINLVDCTVNHEIDLKLIDNPAYRELQRWHIEQVKHRQASLVRNLTSLESMRRIVED